MVEQIILSIIVIFFGSFFIAMIEETWKQKQAEKAKREER